MTTEKLVHEDNQAVLLERYRQTKDIEIRNEIVMHYSYIAKSIAMQMRGIASNYAQIEDIVNQGMLMLIECVDRFEPERGVKFESYAFMRIRGSIIDFIRKQDWLPRRVRKMAKEIAVVHDKLANQLMREPTDAEIADYMNIPVAVINKHYSEMSSSVVFSFEDMLQNSSGAENALENLYDEESMPETSIFKQELRSTLVTAIDSLSERERTVVSLYYYEHLKLNEISKVLEVSESRVCQIHSKAITKLKLKMEKYVKG